ncbi:MAG: AMP-binding protein [Pseudomonadota bacterium]|nr:AMP-binding protein [Pseudomonadota bacterium]
MSEVHALRTPVQMLRAGAEVRDGAMLTFVDIGPDGRFAEETRSYGELLANGARIAGALAGEGMKSGDSFALVMPNHPEFVDAMIGSELAATIFVPIDPRTRGARLAFMLRFAGCRGAIVAPEALPALAEVIADVPDLGWVWVLGDTSQPLPGVRVATLAQVLAGAGAAPTDPGTDLARPMQMLYTSGTTGDPKAILAPYARYAAVSTFGPLLQVRGDDKLYTGLSFTHANAQLITLGNALAMQLPLVVSRRFSKSRLWEILGHYGCTVFNLLGGMAVAIYAEPPSPRDRAHKVRMVLSAGMPPAMWRDFEARFGVQVLEFFGAAEGGLTINLPGVGPIGSIGKPPAGTICAILDEDDKDCAPGVLGEMCFRPEGGETPAVEYFRNPEASAAKTRGGWFRTGDIGYKDADGWVFFSHRAGDAIRRNGDFVNAVQIEAEIAAMDGVGDVHVYGAATAQNAPGEKEVVAAIVPAGDFDPLSVFTHCRERIGSASMPSLVQIVGEIPKTASEKPQARHLITMLGAPDAAVFGPSGPTTITLGRATQ